MALAVIAVGIGGLPVVNVTATNPKLGLPVVQSTNGYGIAINTAANGIPVTFVAATLFRQAVEDAGDQPIADLSPVGEQGA